MSFIVRSLFTRSRPTTIARCVACSSNLARSYSTKMPESTSTVAAVRKTKHSTSILPAGTVMKDLSILKDKPDPLALPDNDYPDWLWTLTDEALADSQSGKKAAELDAEGQVGDARGVGQAGKGFDRQAERRKLRASNKAEIKARNFLRTT
ncbi:hypothetical protein FFLO_02663 [Filobasidium floriforme]|uniref:Large ribosomal subunit protein mL54 n=1 Tax=Filobasidium floriforme TaxID=5210 RepID=A0A8K0NRL7_9TREE|nr:mitochondrial ribosomal protein L37-domain-containing protein [Filobasidium floriforme]KAG7561934.1 hypothetical protein FFLO_02663 [Filobasidium floriforme]KAH8089415.1 mitochondrial ribosomal protein L37-domain-containing protein [Filobasidium floriforme]